MLLRSSTSLRLDDLDAVGPVPCDSPPEEQESRPARVEDADDLAGGRDRDPVGARRRRRRCWPSPLAEVGDEGLVVVADEAAEALAVRVLAELRARVPLAAAPRIGLPAVRAHAGFERAFDDVVAAVDAD